MVVKEYQFSRTCASKLRELKVREDAVRLQEKALIEREAVLAEREKRIMGASLMTTVVEPCFRPCTLLRRYIYVCA